IIATLGMGHDGHTAGIFPYPENPDMFNKLFCGEPLVVYYEATGKHQFPTRITTTVTFFKKIQIGLGFIKGQEKKQKFDLLKSNSENLESLPALAWREIKDVRIFTDLA